MYVYNNIYLRGTCIYSQRYFWKFSYMSFIIYETEYITRVYNKYMNYSALNQSSSETG